MKRCRSKFFSMKVKHLKETKLSLWWEEVKRIWGMIPGSGVDGLQTQLQLGHSDESSVGITDRIDEVLLDPGQDIEGGVSGVRSHFPHTCHFPYSKR